MTQKHPLQEGVFVCIYLVPYKYMKYISKQHLVILMVIVVVLGVMLLIGERFAQPSVQNKNKDIAPPAQVTSDGEKLIYNPNEPQSQMQSKSFIIRPGQSPLSYPEALNLYKNNLLQFNENCQLTNGIRSFNLNNEVMIDNRSSKANTFVVGGNLVAIAPYDFAFMILKEKGTNISVQCGNQKNVATISVQ